MKRKANPTLIGAFVVGALALIFLAVFFVAGGQLFSRKERAVMHFSGSIYGLQVGAPVVFRGVRLGSVTSIGVAYDKSRDTFSIPVTAELERDVIRNAADPGGKAPVQDSSLTIESLVGRGLRAQLAMQSLLTGQLYVDLDFRPDKPSRQLGAFTSATEIPTVSTAIQELKNQVDSIDFRRLMDDVSAIASSARRVVSGPELNQAMKDLTEITGSIKNLSAKLDRQVVPIAGAARSTLGTTQQTMERLGTAADRIGNAADSVSGVANRAGQVLAPDSPLVKSVQQTADELARSAAALRATTADDSLMMQNLDRALRDVSRAARAVRELADSIDQQPDMLIRGRPASAP